MDRNRERCAVVKGQRDKITTVINQKRRGKTLLNFNALITREKVYVKYTPKMQLGLAHTKQKRAQKDKRCLLVL